jgi:hypothetical protein
MTCLLVRLGLIWVIFHFVRLQTLCTHTIFGAYQQLSFTQKQKRKFEAREDPTLGIASPILSTLPKTSKTIRQQNRLACEREIQERRRNANDVALFLHAAGYPTLEENKRKKP